MKTTLTKTQLWFVFLAVALLLMPSCKEDIENDGPIKATDTYLDKNVDKTRYGDFELVLELNNSKFNLSDEINFKLYFSNIGDYSITLPPMILNSSFLPPPIIEIWSDSIRFLVEELAETYDYQNEQIIEPNRHLMFMDFDLNKVKGSICRMHTIWNCEQGIVGEHLLPGTYHASAGYRSLIRYSCSTDTLTFQIK